MRHHVHGTGSSMALMHTMVCKGFLVFMLHCYRASPGSGTTLLRSIDPKKL